MGLLLFLVFHLQVLQEIHHQSKPFYTPQFSFCYVQKIMLVLVFPQGTLQLISPIFLGHVGHIREIQLKVTYLLNVYVPQGIHQKGHLNHRVFHISLVANLYLLRLLFDLNQLTIPFSCYGYPIFHLKNLSQVLGYFHHYLPLQVLGT